LIAFERQKTRGEWRSNFYHPPPKCGFNQVFQLRFTRNIRCRSSQTYLSQMTQREAQRVLWRSAQKIFVCDAYHVVFKYLQKNRQVWRRDVPTKGKLHLPALLSSHPFRCTWASNLLGRRAVEGRLKSAFPFAGIISCDSFTICWNCSRFVRAASVPRSRDRKVVFVGDCRRFCRRFRPFRGRCGLALARSRRMTRPCRVDAAVVCVDVCYSS